MFGLCGTVGRALRQPYQKMSWRESPPLELHESALGIVDLSLFYAYTASIELLKRTQGE